MAGLDPSLIGLLLVAFLIIFFTATFGLACRAHKKKPVTGSEGLIGKEGFAVTDIIRDEGAVLLHGERWSAYSDEPVPKGEKIIVEAVSGLKVKVKRSMSNQQPKQLTMETERHSEEG